MLGAALLAPAAQAEMVRWGLFVGNNLGSALLTASFRPAMALFRDLGVHLRARLCGVLK